MVWVWRWHGHQGSMATEWVWGCCGLGDSRVWAQGGTAWTQGVAWA